MGSLRRLFLRVANGLRPGRPESDLAREISSHLTLLEDDFRERGMSDEQARRAAKRAFGGIQRAKEAHRDARSIPWLDDVRRDLQYAARALGRSPGFAAASVLTLALGIGATTTIFSFVNAVLLKPLGYPDSDHLVAVTPTIGGNPIATAPGDLLEWQAQNHSFEDMAAGTATPQNLTGRGEPIVVLAGLVTDRFAETLRVPLQLGHGLSGEREADRSHSVIISDHLWRRRFNADAAILGTSITVEGTPYTVIGVMPAGVSFPRELIRWGGARVAPDVDLWMPLSLRPNDRANAFLQVIARLKSGVTVAQAQAEMTTISGALARQFMPNERNVGVVVVPLHEQVVRGARPLLLTLLSAVALLLLVACANVANLLLGRATARSREVAIRSALGSGRRRLIQQFLVESLVLGLIGGVAGLLLTNLGIDLIAALIPPGALPRVAKAHIDTHVLIFSAAVSLFTGLIFGAFPALYAARTDLTTALRGATQTARSGYLRVLIGTEIALAFVLLVAAGLLLRSFERLTSVNPGFRPQGVLTVDVTLPEGSYPTLTEMRAFSSAVLDRIAHAPAIVASGAVNFLPIGGPSLVGDFTLEGIPRPRGFTAAKPAVSPGYLAAMGIPLVQGRDFTERDTEQALGVAIVTEGFARRAWAGQNAIGKRLRLGFGRPEQQPWLTVVGLVRDVKQSALADDVKPAIYVPLLQAPRPFLLRSLAFVVRTAVDTESVAWVIRQQIYAVDPALPVGRIATMTQLISDSVSEPRFRTVLLGGFGASALMLIAVGLVGVLGYSVARRTREIGVRTALGAQRAAVAMLVVKQALTTTFIGMACGVPLALVATRLLERFLFEVSPHDPATFLAVGAVLCVTALLASYIPARRAASVDPLVALRCE